MRRAASQSASGTANSAVPGDARVLDSDPLRKRPVHDGGLDTSASVTAYFHHSLRHGRTAFTRASYVQLCIWRASECGHPPNTVTVARLNWPAFCLRTAYGVGAQMPIPLPSRV